MTALYKSDSHFVSIYSKLSHLSHVGADFNFSPMSHGEGMETFHRGNLTSFLAQQQATTCMHILFSLEVLTLFPFIFIFQYIQDNILYLTLLVLLVKIICLTLYFLS